MVEVHANLGLIYFQEGKLEPAIAALRQALKLKPALTKTAALLAISLSEIGRYSEALPGLEKCFRQSIDLPSNACVVCNSCGRIPGCCTTARL